MSDDDDDVQVDPGPSNPASNDTRAQLRELGNTLRDVRTERDQLRELPAQVAQLQRAYAALEQEADRVEDVLQDEIDRLKERNAELEIKLPIEQLAEARAELKVRVAREIRLANELAEVRASKVETENDWATEKLGWEAEKKKLVERINTSGRSGANRIKELTSQIETMENDNLR